MNTDAHRTRSPQRAGTAFGLTLALLPALLLAVGPGLAAGAQPPATVPSAPAGPQLSIAIDNGRSTTESGATLTYTITVRNLGSTDVDDLQVTQNVPDGMTVKSVDSGGTAKGSDVTWDVSLKAAADATFRSTMTVGDTPPEILRLATVACAGMAGSERPIVCATHSDQLPAGAAQEASTNAAGTESSSGARWWWYAAGGAALIVVALLVFLIRRRTNGSSSPVHRRNDEPSPR